jgi:hypothetical protein
VSLGERVVLSEVALGELEVVHLPEPRAEHRQRRRDTEFEVLAARELEVPFQVADALLDPAGHHVGGADHVQPQRRDLGVPELLGQRDGALAPRDALVVVAAEHAHVRLAAVCVGQPRPRGKLLEQLDRPAARLLGVLVPPRRDVRHRQPPEGLALGALVSELPVQLDRLELRVDRLVVQSDQVRLVRVCTEQLGAFAGGKPV